MKYSDVRDQIQDGDVALIAGSGLLSMIVRLLSAGSWSHVAIFYWEGDDVFVSEVREFQGHRITHASTWLGEQLDDGKLIKIGVAPDRVRNQPFVGDFIQNNRTRIKRYSWWALPFVWLSRVTGVAFKFKAAFICSIYVQQAWGFRTKALLPSDFARLCEQTFTITEL